MASFTKSLFNRNLLILSANFVYSTNFSVKSVLTEKFANYMLLFECYQNLAQIEKKFLTFKVKLSTESIKYKMLFLKKFNKLPEFPHFSIFILILKSNNNFYQGYKLMYIKRNRNVRIFSLNFYFFSLIERVLVKAFYYVKISSMNTF